MCALRRCFQGAIRACRWPGGGGGRGERKSAQTLAAVPPLPPPGSRHSPFIHCPAIRCRHALKSNSQPDLHPGGLSSMLCIDMYINHTSRFGVEVECFFSPLLRALRVSGGKDAATGQCACARETTLTELYCGGVSSKFQSKQ